MQIGSMSASAMSQMHAKMFSKIDANSDGGITLEEMTTSATEKSKAKGGSEDSSKIAERFASMDTNGDGSVTEEEGLSFFQSQMSSETMGGMLQAQEEGQGQGQGQAMRPPPSGGAGGGGGQQPTTFDELDTNQDGTVSLDEMLASSESDETEDTERSSRIAEMFSKMDADGDGSVTESEKSAFDEQMRAEGPPPPQGMGVQSWASEDTSEDTTATSASSTTATSTVDSQTAAKMAALTAQWMQSMAALMADQVENSSTVSVAA